MLQAIRDKAQGWFAWGIIILISIPFALWGIQSYLGVGSEPVAATVNGVEITERDLAQRMGRFRDELRDRLGNAYRPELLDDAVLHDRLLNQMIDELVLAQTVRNWDMRASDDMVRDVIGQAFQRDGHFDATAYEVAIRNQGQTQRGFEEGVRHDLVMNQMRQAIMGSAFATQRDVRELVALRDQQRDIAYALIPAESFAGEVSPSDEALNAYYQQHGDEYIVPERVKVAYLLLDAANLGGGVEVSEAQLREYFEQHKGEFNAPEERQVRHILIQAPKGDEAKDAEAKEQVEAILARLRAGEDFAAIAREHSQDPGSAAQGGDLGWVQRDSGLDESFETMAFLLEPNVISEPVRSVFGYHLIEVTAVRAGGEGSFDSLYPQIESAYRKSQGEGLFFDKAERLADLVYETPDTLMPAAETLELTVQESDWFSRNGGSGDLASPKVVAAAFSDDVRISGNNSEVIELGPEKMLVLRVLEYEAQQSQPFDVVRDQVTDAVKQQQSSEKARGVAEALRAEVKGLSDLQAKAEENGYAFHAPQTVKRRDTLLPPAIVEQGFQVLPGDDAVALGLTALANGDYAVFAVTAVRDGDVSALTGDAGRELAQGAAAQLGSGEFRYLTGSLRSQADIEITKVQQTN